MRVPLTLLVLLPVLLLPLAGCGRKVPKATGGEDTPPPPAVAAAGPNTRPAPTNPPGDRGQKDQKADKSEKPNWLNDERFKRVTDPLPDEPRPKSGWSVTPPEGGWTAPASGGAALPPATTRQPVLPSPAPVTGSPPPATGNPAPAPPTTGGSRPVTGGGRPVTRDDLNEIWIFIENRSQATGTMPSPETTYAALVAANARAAELVRDGSIILTGATSRESIWAFERNAPTRGGWVASQNGPEQLTAAQFAQRLGR